MERHRLMIQHTALCGVAYQRSVRLLEGCHWVYDIPGADNSQRFEHDGQNGKSTPKKIDTHIRFPASLNMLPFSTLMLNSRSKNEKEP